MASPSLRSPCARDIWIDAYTSMFDHPRTRVVAKCLAQSRRQKSRNPESHPGLGREVENIYEREEGTKGQEKFSKVQ